MRFLDPDEATLRLLAGGNPFAFESWSRGNRGTSGEDVTNASVKIIPGVATSREEKAEEEDFDTLTESLGGFG